MDSGHGGVCFHWGVGGCFHSGLMGGDSSGNPHGPLCALSCPVLLVPLAAYSCLDSNISMAPLLSPLDIVSAPLPRISPLCPRILSVWGSTVSVAELFLSFDTPYSFCEQHWSRHGPNERLMSTWRCGHPVKFLRFFTGSSTVQYLH